jgi:hypothetical protein
VPTKFSIAPVSSVTIRGLIGMYNDKNRSLIVFCDIV